jgi:DNA-binding HxlR family transcriptional regulator
MPRRRYAQACSVADALDHIGERWSLLIVRELLLGPLRFSDLARAVGGAPTDVLTKRLRDLEADGIVRRVELGPPAAATAYELTEMGRELEEPLLALGRWGLHFYRLEEIAEIGPQSLAGPLQVTLHPPADAAISLQLRSEGASTWLRIEAGETKAGRGEIADPDLTISGPPAAVLITLTIGEAAEEAVEIDGDRRLLDEIRAMVELPERLGEEVRELAVTAASAAP